MEKLGILVGFDGGGTKSRMIVRDEEGSIRRQEFALSIKYTDVGVAESVRRFAQMLHSVAPSENWNTATIAISLSGASEEVKNTEWKTLLAAKFSEKEITCHIESDSSLSLKAAYPNNESGYLLIAGTGSVAMGRDRASKLYKAGGLGRLLGDEGSGYWIGLQALKWYVQEMDRRHGGKDVWAYGGNLFAVIASNLYPETGGEFSILRSKLYSNEIDPARLAPLVFRSAGVPPTTDHPATTILVEGAKALAKLIEKIKAQATGNIEPVITMHGSVCSQPVYSELISEALGDEYEIRVMDEWRVAEFALAIERKI